MKLYAKVFFLVIVWTITLTGILHAQKISLKDVQLNLSLQDYRLEDIIDGTLDDDQIGYVYKGLVNSSLKPVYLDDSVTDEFEKLFKPAFSTSTEAIPLVIRINSIQVNEWSEFFSKKVNLISLSLSIFQQVEDNKYVLIADRVINDYDIDGLINKDIGDGIGRAVDRAFDYLDLYVDTERPSLTWSDLWDYEPFQGLPYPRLADEAKLFEHYSDFRQNKPLEGSTASIINKRAGPVLLDAEGNHPIDIWGYSSQGCLFINMGNNFIPVDRVDNGYAAVLKSNDRRDFQDGVTIFRVSKVIGLLTILTSGKNYELLLSNLTGFLDIKSIYDLEVRKDRSALSEKPIIEFAPFGHPDDVLDIKVDDQLMIQLSKGEFFEVPNSLKAKELKACVGGRCETISIDETPLHRIIFKKGVISQEPFTEKEKIRYLRNVELKYWVLF